MSERVEKQLSWWGANARAGLPRLGRGARIIAAAICLTGGTTTISQPRGGFGDLFQLPSTVTPAMSLPKAMQSCDSLLAMHLAEDGTVREARIVRGGGGAGD